ncbi:hypothetical protein D3C87_1992780 [compost metagenome]
MYSLRGEPVPASAAGVSRTGAAGVPSPGALPRLREVACMLVAVTGVDPGGFNEVERRNFNPCVEIVSLLGVRVPLR